jgi:hypothetical protein
MADAEGLDPRFSGAIQAMIAASHGKLYIESGYRSDATQAALFAGAVKKYGSPEAARKWVAPPGHSNHNKGWAVDLGGDIELAHQLAPQFGLVFPMSWEPWHIEPTWAREKGSAQAYTDGPIGTTNPQTDPSFIQQPQNLLATLASAMKGNIVDAGGTGGQQVQAQAGAGASGGGATSGGASTDATSLYQKLRASGLDPAHAAAGVAIAGRESSYNASAHNPNRSTGDDSYGLFQINKLNGMHSQYSNDSLLTVEGSVAAFADMVKNSGLQPWGGYKGVAWSNGTNLQNAVAASGGEVTLADLQGLK